MDRIRRVVLVVLALFLTLMLRPDWGGEGIALAGVIPPVNSLDDDQDGAPGDGICDTQTILNPSGKCTLRAAIMEANASIGPHTITFDIAGTIQPLSELPAITMPGVTIDGDGDIVLDGSSAGLGANGLVIQTSNTTVRGLVIHGFQVTNVAGNDFSQGNGIVIQMGANNTIEDNFIGTNEDGDACEGNGGSGVMIGGPDAIGNANYNTVRDNLITCNGFQDQAVTGGDGVTIWTSADGKYADGNQVIGNYIGTDVSGTMTLTVGTDTFDRQHIGNTGNGVRITGWDNIVGGTFSYERNIISGNELAGVRIEGLEGDWGDVFDNEVLGNYIGTDVNGTSDLGNLDVGVYIVGLANDAEYNDIAGNLISGNGAVGVFILGGLADHNTVSGNYIGTDVSGTVAMPNDSGGVIIMDGGNNVVGGTDEVAGHLISGNARIGVSIINSDDNGDVSGNLISGNAGVGVSIINSDDAGDASGNVIQDNKIGTDVNGTTALPNTLTGVVIMGAASNDVGGTGAGNLISGNGEYGVIIMQDGATGNDVQGNYIGTDVSGAFAIPNQGAGVLITNASSNTVGGATAAAGNLISGNGLEGVRLIEADDNIVRRNLIGTQADGTSALGNGSHGIVIADSNDNIIGVDGVSPWDNTIAHNGGDGVLVLSGTGNQILSNSIFDNTQLGIDLGDDGVTPNDPGDGDGSPNNLQNYPVLTTASVSGNTTIAGVLNSTPSTQFTIQFFANTACDPSGFGEGRTYLATDTPTTDGSGNTTTSATVAGDLTGQFITATATDPDGNTSEFSNCIPVPSAPVLTIDKQVQDLNGGDALPGDTLLYTINYENTGNAPASGVFITDDYSAYCATISDITNGDFADHDDDGDTIRWPATGGIVFAEQASGSVSYRCTLDDSFPAGTTDVENTATIDSDQTDPEEDTETVPVTAAPVLTVDKQVQDLNGGAAQPGDTLRYTIHYENTGNAPASGVFITDDYSDLCDSISNVTTDANFPTFSNTAGVLRWPQGADTTTLAAGASGSVSYECTLQDAFPLGTTGVTNTSTIDSNETDPAEDTVIVSVSAAVVLAMDKQVQDLNDGCTEPGDTLQYTINYANTGNTPANGVFITDDYSDLCVSINNVTTDANFTTFSDSAGVLRWPQGADTTTLAAGASGSLTYDCALQDPFPAVTTRVTNTSIIDSDETGPEQDTETVCTIRFDFDRNGRVDVGDVMEVAIRWRLTAANPDPDNDPATPNYEPRFDPDEDERITVVDIMTVSAQWGQSCE